MKTRSMLQAMVVAVAVLLFHSGCTDTLSGMSQTRELRKTGLSAKATILKISDTGLTINDDPVAWLDVEVHPAKGAPFRARTKWMISRLEVPQYQPGRTIPVVYDPADHSRVGVDINR
jgi:hypothetical protein